MLSRKLAALAAISMVAGSSAALAQPAPAPVPAVQRAGADVQDTNELNRGVTYLVGAIVLALVLYGVFSVADNSGPASP